MALEKYGVLSGRVIGTKREDGTNTPHYQVHLVDDQGVQYRAAVNVQSQQPPSELRYLVDDDFDHPILAQLPAPRSGWTSLPPQRGAANLDYIRGNLLEPTAMRTLPAGAPGPDNDLADVLDHYVRRAEQHPDIVVYAFGQRWGPEPNTSDKVFGFRPGNGVHDIHMNQGNSSTFAHDDGVWQDGGLLLHLNTQDRWVAVFLAFQSQAWHTDDVTGHALPAPQPRPAPQPAPSDDGEAVIRILAALVNPIGPAPEPETVTLLNTSPSAVDLDGWVLADRAGRKSPLPAGPLQAGATTTITVKNGMALGNKGGTITLLDPDTRKIHGVSYTAEQAHREGWTIAF